MAKHNTVLHNRVTTDYNSIKTSLNKESWDLLYKVRDTNLVAEVITNKLLNTITNNTNIVKTSGRLRPLKPWITKGIVKCIRKRDKLHKATVKAPDNIILINKYRKYRNTCNYIIKELKKQYYQEKLNICKGNTKETWQIIKEVCSMKKSNEHCEELLNIATTPEHSLNELNEYFTGIGNTLANDLLSRMNKTEQELAREASMNTSPLCSFLLMPTDIYEVRGIILGLRTRSASGWDRITTTILKQNINSLVPPITHLCNLSLETGKFPDIFKRAVVCPVYKTGNKNEPTNYRPISLLSNLSKILEKIVNKRIVKYLQNKNLLSDSQFGFREGRSTEDAVLTLTTKIASYVDRGDKCLGVFLDLQKAFDTVSIQILITRLESVGFRGVALNWFIDYLTNRHQRVKIDCIESSDLKCKYGVPQGSTLGPTLFLIYINDLSRLANSTYLDLYMFADDTVLIFHGQTWNMVFNLAEIGLTKVTAWLENSLLSINTGKTKYVCFSKSAVGKPIATHSLKIHTFPCNRITTRENCICASLCRVDCVKYLGVLLDDTLTWEMHITSTIARVRKLVYIFKNLRTVANSILLLQTYRALCECIIRYCICAWGGAAKTHMLGIERAQRMVLKVLLYLPYRHPTFSVYNMSGVLSVRKMFVYEMLRRYHKKTVPYICSSHKRVERCLVPRVKSTFARRHYNFLAPHIYNKCNKVHKIRKLSTHKFKLVITTWLKSIDFDAVENLLKVP